MPQVLKIVDKILLSLCLIGLNCGIEGDNKGGTASAQTSSFYHPEIKAKLKNGKVLLFPSGLRLGTLQLARQAGQRGKSINACGRVELPSQSQVVLVPSSYLLQNPDLINGFSGAISGIEIKNKEGTRLLQQLAAKETIETLRISNITLDSDVLSAINSLPHLKNLQFDRIQGLDIAIAGKIKPLKQLNSLALTADTMPLLKEIGQAKSLKKLELSNANLTLSDFTMLQNLPALEFLSIQESQYADAAVALFPRFKNLKILWLGKRHWSKDTMKQLEKLTNLEELHVQVAREELPLYVNLYNALPGIVKP